MGRPRKYTFRAGRQFNAGAVVKLSELSEGQDFVTLVTGLEGYVVERHSDGVTVDLHGKVPAGYEVHVTRRVHREVRVAVL